MPRQGSGFCPRPDDTLPPDGVAVFATTIPSPPPEMTPGDLPPVDVVVPRSAAAPHWDGFASADLDEEGT